MDIDGDVDDLWSEADEEELAKIDVVFASDHEDGNSELRLECDQLLQTEGTPQQRYRGRYLIVSDFVKQHWCEQQLLYSLSPEVYLMRALPGVEVNIEESAAVKEVKGKGTDIHQARELEIQVPVEVTVITKEDRWAVKFLNLQSAVLAFHSGHRMAREVPVFGVPFGCGLFLYGIIDELQYDPDTHTIEISELKTRKSLYPPRGTQQNKDLYQVGLYAEIFNELVQGKISKEAVGSYLDLDMDQPLSDGVKDHIKSLRSTTKAEDFTLGKVLDVVLSQMQTLTCINQGTVEYVHQDSQASIISIHSTLDTEKVRKEFTKQCEWWRGERGTTGVEIEDCWKCDYCQFSPLCEWRDVMANRTLQKCKR